jgi:hypothetical protein
LWALVTVLLASTGIVPLIYPLLRPASPPPETLAELIELLHRSDPQLHAVAMTDHSPQSAVYFCERPQPRERLQLLRRLPESAGRWRGVAFCERSGRLSKIEESEWQRWGAYGLRIGSLVFFGDPAVLRRIETAIRQR